MWETGFDPRAEAAKYGGSPIQVVSKGGQKYYCIGEVCRLEPPPPADPRSYPGRLGQDLGPMVYPYGFTDAAVEQYPVHAVYTPEHENKLVGGHQDAGYAPPEFVARAHAFWSKWPRPSNPTEALEQYAAAEKDWLAGTTTSYQALLGQSKAELDAIRQTSARMARLPDSDPGKQAWQRQREETVRERNRQAAEDRRRLAGDGSWIDHVPGGWATVIVGSALAIRLLRG